jgi:hypothetical protein
MAKKTEDIEVSMRTVTLCSFVLTIMPISSGLASAETPPLGQQVFLKGNLSIRVSSGAHANIYTKGRFELGAAVEFPDTSRKADRSNVLETNHCTIDVYGFSLFEKDEPYAEEDLEEAYRWRNDWNSVKEEFKESAVREYAQDRLPIRSDYYNVSGIEEKDIPTIPAKLAKISIFPRDGSKKDEHWSRYYYITRINGVERSLNAYIYCVGSAKNARQLSDMIVLEYQPEKRLSR